MLETHQMKDEGIYRYFKNKQGSVSIQWNTTTFSSIYTFYNSILRKSFHLWAESGFYSIWRIPVAMGRICWVWAPQAVGELSPANPDPSQT